MKIEGTKVTSKGQTTIPLEVRKALNVKTGEEVEWHIIKAMIVVNKERKVVEPVKFLTSQIKINLDAVELVKSAREESR